MSSEDGKSLYERLGGKEAINDAVERLYFKILLDPSLSSFFSYDKMESIKRHQTAFFAMATGGPKEYTGRNLQMAHAPLLEQGLNDRHFDALKNHLQEVLKDQKHSAALISEALATIESLRAEILGKTTNLQP